MQDTELEQSPIKPLAEPATNWFVNRTWELKHFWKWANGIPNARPLRSYAMTGARRIGKTAIIHRLFNRLFNEQTKVMPIYISFAPYMNRQDPINAFEFARDFFKGYLQSYLAFQYRMPELLHQERELDDLMLLAEELDDEIILKRIGYYKSGFKAAKKHALASLRGFMHQQIAVPGSLARLERIPTVVFIDEFQILTQVLHPDFNRIIDLTNAFQHAAESRWAPLLVSGSSLTMMVHQALGGMVAGRFRRWHLKPLKQSHAMEMVYSLGEYLDIEINTELAVAIYEYTKGYPHPIEALLNSECPSIEELPDLEALEEVVTYELGTTTGELRDYYDAQYGKYISEINGDNITRQVLLWLTENSERFGENGIFVSEVIAELDLEKQSALDAFDLLCKIDIVERYGRESVKGIHDPMLRRYIRYYHTIQVLGGSEDEAIQVLRKEYQQRMGTLNRRVGHLAEAVVGDILSSFDSRTLDGETFFNVPHPVHMKLLHNLQRQTGIVLDGVPIEIDLLGEHPSSVDYPGNGAWMVQVRYKEEKTTKPDVEKFIEQVEAVRVQREYKEANRWYFSKRGFTGPALELLQEEGIYYNDLEQFNLLANEFGFIGLPKD